MRQLRISSHIIFLTLLSAVFFAGCGETNKQKRDQAEKEEEIIKKVQVTATAYNSVARQTKKKAIGVTAWGDSLEPGERAIAVSRDLIKLGLKHNVKVEIEGLDGTYVVKDKMNRRWKKRIDIYMGLNKEAAKKWGKKKVEIEFKKKKQSQD